MAQNQGGVVSRSQAIRAGLSPGMIKFRVRSGRWRQIHPGVYATFSGGLTRRTRLWAAVLSAGPGAALSHETAAELHRLADKPVELIHLTVPVGRRISSAEGVSLHRSARVMEAVQANQEAAAMPLRTDFFHSILATFRAMAVVAVGDRTAAEALVTDLTPVAGLLAGAASAALAMQPVAQTLGELSAFLGRPQEAARHFAAAQQVARRWNSPHWAARARAAASLCPPNG
jgi:hypothetical protein